MAYELIKDKRNKVPNYIINGNTLYNQHTLDQVVVQNPQSKKSLRSAMFKLKLLVKKSKENE